MEILKDVKLNLLRPCHNPDHNGRCFAGCASKKGDGKGKGKGKRMSKNAVNKILRLLAAGCPCVDFSSFGLGLQFEGESCLLFVVLLLGYTVYL